MQHPSVAGSSLHHRILVVLTLLTGIAVLSACAPDAPPADPAPVVNVSAPRMVTAPEPVTPSSVGRDTNQRPAESESFVGSSKGKTFHRPSCEWAKKIRPSNLIRFRNPEEALKKGYAPCRTCLPR
jgi:hypothetical protein